MVEALATHRWFGRLAYIGLVLALMFLQLLPLQTLPPVWAAPDLILALTLAWVARRPDLVPVWIIALCFLLGDLLFGRAPGLWTALILILTEMLRARAGDLRAAPFAVEWMTVAVGLIIATMANRAILALVMTAQAPLGLTLLQMLATIFAYPVAVGLSHVLFGVSRPAPGEVDKRGQKI